MSDKDDLLLEIESILAPGGANVISASDVDDLYEAYVMTAVVQAALAEQWTVRLEDINEAPDFSAEVEQYIRDFLDGSGEAWDWDDFISIPLDDPELEQVRLAAAEVSDRFPSTKPGHYCSEEGFAELRLLADALRDGDV